MARLRRIGRTAPSKFAPVPGQYAEETRFWRAELDRYVPLASATTRKLGSSALEGEVYTVWRDF